MADSEPQCRPPPVAILRLLFEHQRWLNSQGRFGKRLDEQNGLQFENYDLSGVDFSGATLDWAYFRGGSVKGARFIGASLLSAVFNECDVADADFSNAKLRCATFATNSEHASSFEGAELADTAWDADQGERMFAARREQLRIK
jgi:uncharacterized protein YjbI with pentapeptide repeats